MKTRRHINKSKSGHFTAAIVADGHTLFNCIMLPSSDAARDVLTIAERMLKTTGEIDVAAFAYRCRFYPANVELAKLEGGAK